MIFPETYCLRDDILAHAAIFGAKFRDTWQQCQQN